MTAVPEGLRVQYKHIEFGYTPNGRRLLRPHRATMAYLIQDHEEEGRPGCIVGVGMAMAKEGPAQDEVASVGGVLRAMRQRWDQFSRPIGRELALERAVADFEEQKSLLAEALL